MRIAHYYHIYVTEKTPAIIDYHLDALVTSGLAEHVDFRIGVINNNPLYEAQYGIVERCKSRIPNTTVVVDEPVGWEQPTLNKLYEQRNEYDVVLYAHTKGAVYEWPNTPYWRSSMTDSIIKNWRFCLEKLETHDAVGAYWFDEGSPIGPHYSGNYWWSKPSTIERLTYCENNSRYDAEAWIGKANLNPQYCTILYPVP